MKETLVTIDIIIINYNSGEMLKNCLNSIFNLDRINFILKQIIIVDNNSNDESIKNIEDIDLPIRLIKNKENIGYGRACNLAAKFSNSDYILFLNPDVILMKNSLEEIINFLKKNNSNKYGVIGIQLLSFNNKISRTCCRFPNLLHFINKILGLDKLSNKIFKTYFMTDWDHNESRRVDHVIGAFYFIKRDLFFKVDGFDEKYFLYFEDLDLSYKLHKIGYEEFYLTTAKALHKGGGSSGKMKDIRLYYSLESRILFCYKYFNFLFATIIFLLTIFIEPFTRLFYFIMKFNYNEIYYLFKNYLLLWKRLPLILKRIKE